MVLTVHRNSRFFPEEVDTVKDYKKKLDVYSLIIQRDLKLVLVKTIDLVLIDPQSVGKRTHDLMDTVNAKKRWKTI
jgi:uncharacterized protein YbbC (DUF1343 family)